MGRRAVAAGRSVKVGTRNSLTPGFPCRAFLIYLSGVNSKLWLSWLAFYRPAKRVPDMSDLHAACEVVSRVQGTGTMRVLALPDLAARMAIPAGRGYRSLERRQGTGRSQS